MKLTPWKESAEGTAKGQTVVVQKDNFAAKLGALRKATGRPERFVTPCRCAVHDRPFMVVYERFDRAERFTVARINLDSEEMECSVRHPLFQRLGVVADIRRVPAAEIDLSGWKCPHCGAADLVIDCQDCGVTVCGGRTAHAPGKESIFNCRPSCGARGSLMDSSDVKGVNGRKDPLQLRGPGTPVLPRFDHLRLKGPKS